MYLMYVYNVLLSTYNLFIRTKPYKKMENVYTQNKGQPLRVLYSNATHTMYTSAAHNKTL